jgi:hypothetical protein
MSYNKNHGTSTVKKIYCHEHPYLYKKWGLFLLQRVTKTQSEKQGSKKRKIVPLSQITYVPSCYEILCFESKCWLLVVVRCTSPYALP